MEDDQNFRKFAQKKKPEKFRENNVEMHVLYIEKLRYCVSFGTSPSNYLVWL